jgi:phage terminase small subunit
MRRRQKKAPSPSSQPLPVPDGLTPAQYAFALHYLANGFNASAAYRAAHEGVTDGTSRVEGCRTLAHPSVRAFLNQQLGERWKPLQMDGDEALARVALDARSDVRDLFSPDGQLLPVHQWPDAIANSVDAFEQREDGTIKVKLVPKLQARRVVLEATGKLKSPMEGGLDALASLLAKRYEEAAK